MSDDYFRNEKSMVTEIDQSYFDNDPATLKNKSFAVVLFYASWCPHCKAVKDTWKEFAKKVGGMCQVYAFNCANPNNLAHFEKIKRSKSGLIPSFPTIVFYKNGEPIETLPHEKRNLKDLMSTTMRLVKN